MNSKPSDPPITPGIREALHPGLGNGAALEDEKHAFLLRLPDPSKLLEPFLASADEPNQFDNNSELAEEKHLERSQDATFISHVDRAGVLDKDADGSGAEDDLYEQPDKAPKPGKRLKKAVKSVQKEEPIQMEPTLTPQKTESTLSPYTLWLKRLSGSEYVHPYDDDFALRQEPPASGEGISETYADLLAAQGYKDQAIEMYKRLMEKYPEKSGFFAAKIEALS